MLDAQGRITESTINSKSCLENGILFLELLILSLQRSLAGFQAFFLCSINEHRIESFSDTFEIRIRLLTICLELEVLISICLLNYFRFRFSIQLFYLLCEGKDGRIRYCQRCRGFLQFFNFFLVRKSIFFFFR